MQGIEVKCGRHSGFAGLALVLMAQQILVRNDVRPVIATRIVHTQQYLAETGEPGQSFKCLSGQ